MATEGEKSKGCYTCCCGDGGPPVDKGYSWVICAACAVMFMVAIGINKSLGIILVIMQNEFQSDPSLTSATVSMAAAGIFLFVTVANGLGLMWGYRTVCIIGSITTTLAMLATAFAPSVVMVIFTLGLISGIGYSCMFGPPMVILSTYFSKRRALAVGLAMAGGSVGAIILPQLLRYLLEEYGFKGAILLLSGIIMQALPASLLLRPISFYTKSRLQKKKAIAGTAPPKPTLPVICKKMFDKELICNPVFVYFVVMLIFAQGGYFGALIFLPTIINSEFDNEDLAYLVPTIIGVSDLIGRLVFGALADVKRIPKNYLLGISLLVPGSICFVAYFFTSLELMMVSVVAIGIMSGAYVPMMSPMIVEYFGLTKVSSGFGLCTFAMGIIIVPLPIGMTELGKASGYQNVFLMGAVLTMAAGASAIPLDIIRRLAARRQRHKDSKATNQEIAEDSIEKEALGIEGMEGEYDKSDGVSLVDPDDIYIKNASGELQVKETSRL